jgi:hypothetical protein
MNFIHILINFIQIKNLFYLYFDQTKKPTILIIVLQHSTPNNAPGVNRRTKLVSSQFVPASLNVHPDPE